MKMAWSRLVRASISGQNQGMPTRLQPLQDDSGFGRRHWCRVRWRQSFRHL